MPPARQVGHERTSSRAVRKRVSGWPLRNSLAAPYRECGGGHAAFSDRCAGAGRRGQRRRRNERRRLQGLCRSRSGRGAARDRAASLIDVHITLTSSMPIITRRPQISEPAPARHFARHVQCHEGRIPSTPQHACHAYRERQAPTRGLSVSTTQQQALARHVVSDAVNDSSRASRGSPKAKKQNARLYHRNGGSMHQPYRGWCNVRSAGDGVSRC
jgi:hypothetical protein